MPRIVSYTPQWLSRGSPGFDVFSSSKSYTSTKLTNNTKLLGQPSTVRRTITHRGTEIFVVAGNEIRWSDLVLLQEKGGAEDFGASLSRSKVDRHATGENNGAGVPYRVLKVPVSGHITQLLVSPNGDYMAIITSHTIHIAVLPDPSHLDAQDSGPLKLRTFHLGPTAHVLEQSAIASVLWHPLGYRGRCLVTVTTDAVVRLWEVNDQNRSSFSDPTLAVDLKKLVNATSADEDVGASGYGVSKGFSPDSIELEVAAACFGAPASKPGQHPWSPMTLWLATVEGDIYALCPFLPNKWQWTTSSSGRSAIETFSTSIYANYEETRNGPSTSEQQRHKYRQQLQWINELMNQEPLAVEGRAGGLDDLRAHSRPSGTPAIPRLQGPFEVDFEIDGDGEVSDIYVSQLKTRNIDDVVIKQEFEEDDEELQEDHRDSLATAVICLLTSKCSVHIYLDFEGIDGLWLPKGKTKNLLPSEMDGHDLLLIETIHLRGPSDSSAPSFSPSFTMDIASEYASFITDVSGIYYLSMSSWIHKLEDELSNPHEEGVEFRLDVLLDGATTLVESLLQAPQESLKDPASPGLTSCIVLKDSDVGYFLLTMCGGRPLAAILDCPDNELQTEFDPYAYERETKELLLKEPREAYEPPEAFYRDSILRSYFEKQPARRKTSFKDEIRLSPATLDVLTEAHRILSSETHRLGLAAADLFRRCERLQDEFKDQIKRANELATRIDRVTGDDEDEFGEEEEDRLVGNARLEDRLAKAQARQQELLKRHEELRRKVASIGGQGLSDKEKAWFAEVKSVEAAVMAPEEERYEEEEGEILPAWKRLKEVKQLKQDVVPRANQLATEQQDRAETGAVRVPEGFRKQKIARVMELLERESVLVDAATERLNRLKMQTL